MKNKDVFNYIKYNSRQIKKETESVRRKIEKMIIQRRLEPPQIQISLSGNIIKQGTQKMNYHTSRTFESVLKKMEVGLSQDYKIKLTKKDIQNLSLKKSAILESVTMESAAMQISVKNMLLKNIGKGLSFQDIVIGLKKLYPSYERNCYTVANTGIQRLYKDGTFSKTKELFQKFKYLGPDDNVTRPFCASHVGKVYPKKEAEQLQSEIMSLYNCRHALEPVDEKIV